jgi:hypothetical protein
VLNNSLDKLIVASLSASAREIAWCPQIALPPSAPTHQNNHRATDGRCETEDEGKGIRAIRDEWGRAGMRFGRLKSHYCSERLRPRDISDARDEFHPAAIATTIKTMA